MTGLLIASACAHPVTSSQYAIDVRVVSDPEVPLSAAELRRGGQPIARSDERGSMRVTLSGQPGDVVQLELVCPEGYRAPDAPLSVLLRELQKHEHPPEYVLACAPLTRTVVVAVRATQGAHLPLRYLGEELARTDAAGVAHALVHAKPGETLTLTLDTSREPQLMPQNPELRVNVPERDELFVFDQVFRRPKPKPRPVAPPPPLGPQRI